MIECKTDNTNNLSGELIHIRDVNSHDIFKNNVLTSQFLRDYTGISILSDIKPEDIEDQTKKFKMLLGIEIEGDTIKKIRLRIGDKTDDIYVISLIEHKSSIDYDTAMQLNLYMSVIWRDYARGCNDKKKNANKAKEFRYPLIIPIVYYEGSDKWTAGMHLSDRIAHSELAKECIPDFTYKIVHLREFDNNDLITNQDEMSLIMLINKIQGAEDFHNFRKSALNYFTTIYSNTSADIQRLILDVIWGLLMKINVPEEKATEVLTSVKEGDDMGVLFENFKTFDYQEATEKRKEAEKKLKQVEAEIEEAEAKVEEAEAKVEEAEAKVEEAEAKVEEAEAKAEEAEARAEMEKARADRLERELQELRRRGL